MQLSQVDPWNGCRVCRALAERGVAPTHNWTHNLRMWWSGKVPAWTYGTEPTCEGEGLKGATFTAVGVALANLVNNVGLTRLPGKDNSARTAEYIRPVVEMAAAWNAPARVVLTDGGKTVDAPVTGVGYDGHVLHVYAEVKP